jgi:hypothetical protein
LIPSGLIALNGIENPKDSNISNKIINDPPDPIGVVCFAIIFVFLRNNVLMKLVSEGIGLEKLYFDTSKYDLAESPVS